MKVQQSHSQIKKSDVRSVKSSNISSDIAFKKGEIFTAKVINSSGKIITLELADGSKFVTKNLSGRIYNNMQKYDFEVLEQLPSVSIRLVENKEQELMGVLSKLFPMHNKNISSELITASRELSHWGLPLSVDNIEAMAKELKYINMLIGLIQSNKISMEQIPADMPLKDVIFNYFSEENISENVNNLKRSINRDIIKSLIMPKIEDIIISETNNDNIKDIKNNSDALLQKELVGVLQKINPELLAFHKKIDVQNSIQSTALFDNLFGKKFSIANQFEQLGKIWSSNISQFSTQTQQLIKHLLSNGKDVNAKKVLEDIIQSIKQSDNYSNNTKLQQSVQAGEQLSKSISYIKQVQENLAYLQWPVVINDEMRTVDFFVKKNTKKQSRDGAMTIFLSLETHQLDTVQALVSYEKNRLGINFILENDNAYKIFDNRKLLFKDTINKMIDKEVVIHVTLKEKKRIFDIVSNFFSNDNKMIDVKV